MKGTGRRALEIAGAFLGTLLVLGVLRQILILVVASLLRSIAGAGFWIPLTRPFLASPVYAELMIKTLQGIDPRGIAIAGALGDALHQIFPSFFLDPQFAWNGAWVSAVLDENSTVLSLLVTRAVVEAILINLGALLLYAGWQGNGGVKSTSPWAWSWSFAGLFTQAQAISALFSITLNPAFSGLEEAGVGIVLSRLFQVDRVQYNWLMSEFLPLAIPSLVVALALLGSGGLVSLLHRRKLGHVLLGSLDSSASRLPFIQYAAALGILTAGTALVPWLQDYVGIGQVNVASYVGLQTPEAQVTENTRTAMTRSVDTPTAALPGPTLAIIPPSFHPASVVSPTPVRADTPASVVTPTLARATARAPTPSATPAGPTKVVIGQGDHAWEWIVNGEPIVLTGMNYNVNYTAMTDETKRALHRRDFRIMQEAGVNAIIGWGVYDEMTLQVAHEYGIGVILPFELDPQGAYENENYRQQVRDEFRAFVQRFKNLPSLWAWNPGGDELLHRMDTEQHRTSDKLQAAADFMVELSSVAYALDPNHVSVIKEPRDVYVQYLEASIKRIRAQADKPDPGSYLVYGVNVYGTPDAVAEALQTARRNAEERMRIALVVGEYAPFGMARSLRATHYAIIWDDVVRFSRNGGFAYVFGPDQPNPRAPNPYDSLRLLTNEFSLVDNEDRPVDDALSTLGAKYRSIRVTRPSRRNEFE